MMTATFLALTLLAAPPEKLPEAPRPAPAAAAVTYFVVLDTKNDTFVVAKAANPKNVLIVGAFKTKDEAKKKAQELNDSRQPKAATPAAPATKTPPKEKERPAAKAWFVKSDGTGWFAPTQVPPPAGVKAAEFRSKEDAQKKADELNSGRRLEQGPGPATQSAPIQRFRSGRRGGGC